MTGTGLKTKISAKSFPRSRCLQRKRENSTTARSLFTFISQESCKHAQTAYIAVSSPGFSFHRWTSVCGKVGISRANTSAFDIIPACMYRYLQRCYCGKETLPMTTALTTTTTTTMTDYSPICHRKDCAGDLTSDPPLRALSNDPPLHCRRCQIVCIIKDILDSGICIYSADCADTAPTVMPCFICL